MNILLIGRFQFTEKTRHVLELSRELAKGGNRVALYMPGAPSSLVKHLTRALNGITILPEMDEKKILSFVTWEQVNLIHLFSETESPLVWKVAQYTGIPYIVSIDGNFNSEPDQFLKNAGALITSDQVTLNRLKESKLALHYYPDGVNPELYGTGDRTTFKVALLGDRESFTAEGYYTIAKAVDLLGVPLEVVSPLRPASLMVRHHGWLPFTGHVLTGTEVVIASGRAAMEGLAGRNAVLLMGAKYRGIFHPGKSKGGTADDFRGSTGTEPCYRDIFYDISLLMKDGVQRKKMQDEGYSYIRRNYDLRLIAEHITRLYVMTIRQP